MAHTWINSILKKALEQTPAGICFQDVNYQQLGSDEAFASLLCLPAQVQHPSIDMEPVETSFFLSFLLVLLLEALLEHLRRFLNGDQGTLFILFGFDGTQINSFPLPSWEFRRRNQMGKRTFLFFLTLNFIRQLFALHNFH